MMEEQQQQQQHVVVTGEEQQQQVVFEAALVVVAEIFLRRTMKYGDVNELKVVYKKVLTDSDVNVDQARFAMPRNEVLTPFLCGYEDLYIQWKLADGSNAKIPVEVVAGLNKYELNLSRWNYAAPNKKENNNNNNNNKKKSYPWKYVLNGGWKKLIDDHNLQSGQIIYVISFRFNGHYLGFLLHLGPPPPPATN